ncbi:hypothetical protein GGP41_009153 [Bipolaris sorokiniana]|uniref:Uncharacterized protein n=1 Tax=Cochliobolus sativus TaxID=45130 RepID=A0A8H5ZEP8_COCSA|nr:hypothetical protein GGP41_009153 [Bipolaris sorokiniana]
MHLCDRIHKNSSIRLTEINFGDALIGAIAKAHAWRPTLDNAASQVQLLFLHRQRPVLNDLTVNLEVFNIEDAPKFQVLFYTWRSPFPDEHPETPLYNDFNAKH